MFSPRHLASARCILCTLASKMQSPPSFPLPPNYTYLRMHTNTTLGPICRSLLPAMPTCLQPCPMQGSISAAIGRRVQALTIPAQDPEAMSKRKGLPLKARKEASVWLQIVGPLAAITGISFLVYYILMHFFGLHLHLENVRRPKE